jgi:uncharacterized protein with FMN-binding domain
MKKTIAASIFIWAFLTYAAYQHFSATPVTYAASIPVAPSRAVSSTSGASAPPKSAASQGIYHDGTYTGSVANAYYGNVQVEAIVQGGKLADVKFLQYPSDRSTSRGINSSAMTGLVQEAIAAQSAQVNGVSGATDTTAAFRQSLSSALQAARA